MRWPIFGLDKYCELIRRHVFVLMNAGLQMPALKIAAIAAGKSTRAESSHRCTLPKPVIDICGQRGLPTSWVRRGLADCDTPGSLRYFIACQKSRGTQ